MAETKTIKVDEAQLCKVIRAKERLIEQGINSLPEEIKKMIVKEFKEEDSRFTNGLMVEIGALMLLDLLNNIKHIENQTRFIATQMSDSEQTKKEEKKKLMCVSPGTY